MPTNMITVSTMEAELSRGGQNLTIGKYVYVRRRGITSLIPTSHAVLASSKEGKGKGSSLLPKLSPAEVPHFPQLKHTMTDKAGCSVTGGRN